MRKLFSFVLLLVGFTSYSQSVPDFEAIDSLYREDQFYFSTTYNIFSKKPFGVSQNSFSVGLTAGFLRDFPLNKNRTVAIAPGLGFSYNNYKQNLVISEIANTRNYSLIAADVALDKNKLSFLSVDVPLEIRWRTSTFDSHKFWRIYSGLKASYVLLSRSKYIADNGNYTVVNNPDINKFQYGVYISAGYNTWNLYTYYGLNSLFNKDILSPNGNFKTLNIGLMFYIL
jgi:hypothetical protein